MCLVTASYQANTGNQISRELFSNFDAYSVHTDWVVQKKKKKKNTKKKNTKKKNTQKKKSYTPAPFQGGWVEACLR